jgi:hypothetical protein
LAVVFFAGGRGAAVAWASETFDASDADWVETFEDFFFLILLAMT